MAEKKNPGRELAGSAGAEENTSYPNPTGGSGSAAHPAAAFLRLLGKDPAHTYFRTLQRGTATNRSRRGCDLKGFDPEALARDNTSQSIYFVTGNASTASGKGGGVQGGDITACPALFAEWDDKSIDWQVSAWRELGLPEPTMQVLTGGKSVHCYWVLNEPMPPAQWRALQTRLIGHCGSDPLCKDPNRVMRLPGFAYIDKTTGKPNGRVVEVIHSSTARYSPEQIAACLPPPPPESGPSSRPADKAPAKASNLPHRPLEQIESAAQFIPERVVGGNTYEECRNALCGCAAALAAIGQPEERALDLLASKWPARCQLRRRVASIT